MCHRGCQVTETAFVQHIASLRGLNATSGSYKHLPSLLELSYKLEIYIFESK